jgi:carbonic anhydrase
LYSIGYMQRRDMPTASQTLQALRAGNERYVNNVISLDALISHAHRADFAPGQNPSAIILGCSDSRVPAELVFDQGVGDLFVVRVAGNIAAPSQVGSIEFAATRFGCRLIIVLGHSHCGAVTAALEEERHPSHNQSQNLRAVIDRVHHAIEHELKSHPLEDDEVLIERAVRANVRAAADYLRHGSLVLERLIRDEGLAIVGAEYSLETGVVDFFDGADELI